MLEISFYLFSGTSTLCNGTGSLAPTDLRTAISTWFYALMYLKEKPFKDWPSVYNTCFLHKLTWAEYNGVDGCFLGGGGC